MELVLKFELKFEPKEIKIKTNRVEIGIDIGTMEPKMESKWN